MGLFTSVTNRREPRNDKESSARCQDKPSSTTSPTGLYATPTARISRQQLFYLLCLDGIFGMLISAGINLIIAYVMYKGSNEGVWLFRLPNTLAGDAAVTIIAQGIITWFLKYSIVHHDLRQQSVQPIGFFQEPTSKLMRWCMFLPQQSESGFGRVKINSFRKFAQHLSRALLLTLVFFILLWPASVGILTTLGVPQGNDYYYGPLWLPQIFKTIFAGLHGLLSTPLMSLIWLTRAGWEVNRDNQEL